MREKIAALSEQQKACLRLVAEGKSSKEIAMDIGLSPTTIDTYLNKAAMVLGALNRRDAARILTAYEAGHSRKSRSKSEQLAALTQIAEPSSADQRQPEPQSTAQVEDVLSEMQAPFRAERSPAPGFHLSLPPIGGLTNDLSKTRRLVEIAKATAALIIGFGVLFALMISVSNVLR